MREIFNKPYSFIGFDPRNSYASQPGANDAPGTFSYHFRRDKWFLIRQLSCFLFLFSFVGVLLYQYTWTGGVFCLCGLTSFFLFDFTDDLLYLEVCLI